MVGTSFLGTASCRAASLSAPVHIKLSKKPGPERLSEPAPPAMVDGKPLFK
jgi:hypothetical protein